jgi:methionyl-tRNA formyltransferase
MRIIFIGTTEFGIPTLEKLKAQHELVLVISQPDRPFGRKKELTPPPVKVWALKNNIQVLQSENISNLKALIEEAKPDLSIVAAYGQIIPKNILDIPKFKSINIHGSLLPKYRGASPIQATILNLEPEAGITLIQMDEKMDHGPMLAKSSIKLNSTETFPELYKKLADLAASLIEKTLPDFFEGKIRPEEQLHERATFCKMIKRDDAKIDWSKPAKQIDAMVRAYNPEPGTWTTLDGKTIKILKTSIINDHKIELPGKIYFHQSQLAVKTLDNSLIIAQIQPEGKSVMSGKDFLNGLKSGNKLFI